MRIWLASFPRSGNALLRVILKSLHGVASTTIYPKEAAGRFTAFLGGGRPAPEGDAGPEFVKTHELAAAEDASPALYLVRDGRDAYVSYAHFAIQLDPAAYAGVGYEEVLRTLIESREHFGGWSEHIRTWSRRLSPTALLRYEEMLANPGETVARACAAIGIALPPSSGTLPAGEELRSLDPLSFRRGTAGSWKYEMPSDLHDLFWKLHGPTMEDFGYRREG
jgi:hypothetical protein